MYPRVNKPSPISRKGPLMTLRISDPIAEGTPITPFERTLVALPGDRHLACARWGDPDGNAVFWYHGTPGSRHQLPLDSVEVAKRHNLQIVSFARPGTGGSTNHRYQRVLEWGGDMEIVADHFGLGKIAAAGLSGGGPYTLSTAYHFGDRLVHSALLGGVGPLSGPESSPGLLSMAAHLAGPLEFARDGLGKLFSVGLKFLTPGAKPIFNLYSEFLTFADKEFFKIPEMRQMFLYDILEAASEEFATIAHDAALFTRDWGFSLSEIQTPVTLWWGEADHIVPIAHAHHMHELLPDSRIELRPGGHFAGFMAADEVLKEIASAF